MIHNMSFEYYLRFDDPAWLKANREEIAHMIERLPSYGGRVDDAFWLKQPQFNVPDVRIWIRDDHVFIERTAVIGQAVQDIATLVKQLAQRTPVRLVNEDGELTDTSDIPWH